jgi:hypothetical protein
LEQQILFYELLLRSLDLLIVKGLNESGVNELRNDISDVANLHGWV